MTELERIEIEGFKGIESLAFEPSGVNLITGRNNTGKTSLLESIDILFNPKGIQKFGGETGSLVNTSKEKAEIQGRTIESQTAIEVRKPSDEEVKPLLLEAVFENLQFQLTFSGFQNGGEGKDRIRDIQNLVRDIVENSVKDDIIYEVKEDSVVLLIDGEEYPYLSMGPKVMRMISTVQDEIHSEIMMNIDGIDYVEESRTTKFKREKRESENHGDQKYGRVISSLNNWFGHDPKSKFLWKPKGTTEAKFIRGIELAEGIEKNEGGDIAVKIDDIGDYIEKHDLVDNLKTFDLDYLVFEDDNGGKYQVPYDFMGDGFKAIVGLLWELLDDDIEDQIVLLEEPENHMHPGYTRQVVYFLIQLAREENIQLFITTHNNDFINDFFNENLTDEQREFLEEEFTLVRMEEQGAMVVDYETAEGDLKDLHLDLRGI